MESIQVKPEDAAAVNNIIVWLDIGVYILSASEINWPAS